MMYTGAASNCFVAGITHTHTHTHANKAHTHTYTQTLYTHAHTHTHTHIYITKIKNGLVEVLYSSFRVSSITKLNK